MSEKVSLYNPRDTPPEQLEAMLTGREHLLKEILDSLREQAGAPTRQHWLLRGPRGIGKTHLTGIIHHRVSTDPELSKVYLPLWLGEADVYEVYSPATLLMRIAERLVEAVSGTKIAEALLTLEGTGDEDALFEELAAHLTEEAERQGRILLVLMENLDALFESFAPKQRTAQTRQLRSLLLGNPRVLFISTTPTRYLQELSNPKAPLFAQLKERRLSPLKVEEVGALFSKLTQITGRKELLGTGPDAALKQRIIHQLTGGLPRSVVMAFEILRDQEGIQALVEDLRTFLDAQTAYFEARLSRLAARERAIVTTLALAEQNLTLKEIADKSRLPEKSLSTLVARLAQEGHIETMEGSGGKGTLHGLSEGLFRIWYQYRKGRMLLEPLVRFLAYWYEPRELEGVFEAMQQRLDHDGPRAGRAARLTFLQVQAAFHLATSEHGRMERQRIWEECRRAVEHDTPPASPQSLEPTLKRALSEVIHLVLSGKEAEGQAALDRALVAHEPLTEHTALESARFLIQQALATLQEKGLRNAEIFRLIATRFDERRHASVRLMTLYARFCVIEHLYALGRRDEALHQADAILARQEAEESKPQADLFFYISVTRMVLLKELGRNEEAIIASKTLLDDIRSNSVPKSERITHYALFAIAECFRVSGRQREQEEALAELVHRDARNLPREFQQMFAISDFELFDLRHQSGRIKPDAVPRVLEAFIEKHRAILSSWPPKLLSGVIGTRIQASIDADKKLIPSNALRLLFSDLLDQDIAKAASVFLVEPRPIFLNFPASEVGTWLKEMLEAEIPAEQKQQLRLHIRLAELLDAATTKSPEASTRLRQKLGRIPPELQELYKSLVATLRESH